MTEDNTRPVSVAELLARNGTIGSPPVGGHRRRKRRNAVSVAELTGEIPVIRTGEIPVVVDEETADHEDGPADYGAVDHEPAGNSETVIVYSSSSELSDTYANTYAATTPADVTPDYSDHRDYTPSYDETGSYETGSYETGGYETGGYETGGYETGGYETGGYETAGFVEPAETYVYATDTVDYATDTGAAADVEPVEPAVPVEPEIEAAYPAGRPPLSSLPLPRRRRGPQRGHDPRPRRRSAESEPARGFPAAAEQMSPDPVDEAVDLAELVAERAPAPAELRSYLKSSTTTLFFGETVADDMARRGEVAEPGYGDHGTVAGDYEADGEAEDGAEAPRGSALSVLGTSLVAVLQSLLAVVFGAGLFIGFDQLWRWNNIVALALSALVIAALMIGVHVVRKTEDFVSTLIAALVGILVTFGPLALQST